MTDDRQQWTDALHAELVRRDHPAAWVREADAMEAEHGRGRHGRVRVTERLNRYAGAP
jgi:hypothetical protein